MNTYEIFTTEYSIIVQAETEEQALVTFNKNEPGHPRVIAIIDVRDQIHFLTNKQTDMQTAFLKFQGKVINTAFIISAMPSIIKDSEMTSYEIVVKVYNGMDAPVTLWQGFQQQDDMNTEFSKLEKLLGL